MLVKPDINDETIIACLQVAYGLRTSQITFLPLGGDLSTAVYRVVADDGTPYFCKLKRGTFDETSVELPRFLSDQGIPHIIPPLTTSTGQLRAELGEFKLILYPFVEGKSGYEVELSERQWAEFGAALKRVHTVNVPRALSQTIRRESYASGWRDLCRSFIERLDHEKPDDPIAVRAASFLNTQRETILECLERAESLAHVMASGSLALVLCHSDVHAGNLLISSGGALFIVDWDYPVLAPKERDLMFVGGGQGFVGVDAQQEEERFYRGYGDVQIDAVALAYYRYERNITDISVECGRIFSNTLNDHDRAQALEYLKMGFLPGSTMEMAYASDRGYG